MNIEIIIYSLACFILLVLLFLIVYQIVTDKEYSIKFYNYSIKYDEDLEKYYKIISKQKRIILRKKIKLFFLKLFRRHV